MSGCAAEVRLDMRLVYFDHDRAGDQQRGFRVGVAGVVLPDEFYGFEAEERVGLSANTLHALHGHGVVDALARLPLEIGPLEPGRQALLSPSCLDDAAVILYEADRTTYGARHEFVAGREIGTPPVEYRLVVDNREYQRSLARLQFLVTSASRSGLGVWLQV